MTEAPEIPRTPLSVVGWWERRRLAYNLLIGCVGLASFVVFASIVSLPGMIPPGEDAYEPIFLFFAPVLANIAYTAGWGVELVLYPWSRRRPLAPWLMRAGLCFSLLLVAAPALVWLGILAARVLSGTLEAPPLPPASALR
jgi:hypothetical protein